MTSEPTDPCTTEWFQEHGLAGVAALRAENERLKTELAKAQDGQT